ncbi:MAG: MFS transporter [Bacillota bacterium]|nr:MFS transporter [Bacillota bacterium]
MKGFYKKHAALYNFSYMSIGALLPLIGQYLSYIGFSGTQIGTITATGTAVAIFASTFWGREYSRSEKKHEILMLLCLMAAFVCLLLSNIREYHFFLIVFGIMYFFQAPIMSLTDAFTVESERGEQSFGQLRAWGAVGFALGVFLAGNAAEALGLPVVFWFYIGSFLVSAGMIWLIKRGRIDEERCRQKVDAVNAPGYMKILSDKWIRRLILCAFFMGGTNVANNTYFSFLYIEGGGTVAGVGVAMLLMVGSEVPFMAWCGRLSARFTMERVILAAMVISVCRFLLFGIGLPWWMLILLSFSQGAVNGILLIEFVRYVAALAPEGGRSLAISTYYIIGSNLSTICCQMIGGVLLDVAGASGVYLFFGLFNLTGVALYLLFGLHRKRDKNHVDPGDRPQEKKKV